MPSEVFSKIRSLNSDGVMREWSESVIEHRSCAVCERWLLFWQRENLGFHPMMKQDWGAQRPKSQENNGEMHLQRGSWGFWVKFRTWNAWGAVFLQLEARTSVSSKINFPLDFLRSKFYVKKLNVNVKKGKLVQINQTVFHSTSTWWTIANLLKCNQPNATVDYAICLC